MKLSGLKCRAADPDMTFATFIEGESNRLARAMAMATCDNPGKSFNPLYIYGARGLGKSHLLHAIANKISESGRKALICVQKGVGQERVHIDSRVDTIIIDGVNLGDKGSDNAKTGESLTAFAAEGGQLIFSGSVPPESLPDSPLSSLIREHGKSADIGLPEEELRIAILRERAEIEEVTLPDDAAEFLASHISNNIASLIGGLKRVVAHSALAQQKISRFTAIESLKDYIWNEKEDASG